MLESLLNKTAAFKASDFIEKHSTTGVFVRILRNFWEQLFLIPPHVHYTSHFKFYVVINSLDVLGYKIDFDVATMNFESVSYKNITREVPQMFCFPEILWTMECRN